MKLVVAIIRPERLNEVLEALYRAEVRGLTISRVRERSLTAAASEQA